MIPGDGFYEDEVREGYFIPSQIKQAWGAELIVLNQIDKVCRANNIKYTVSCGTLLGAVRHRGFIPWDDDLDVTMLRPDYEKFLEHVNEMDEGFSVTNFRTDHNHIGFLANVTACNHICFEPEHLQKFHGYPYISGVDIFVLDYIDRDKEKDAQIRELTKYIIRVADAIFAESISKEEAGLCIRDIETKTGEKIPTDIEGVDRRAYIYRIAEKVMSQVNPEDSDEVVQMMPWGLYHNAQPVKKEYYENRTEIPYEFGKVFVPLKYNYVAKRQYGDYMKVVKGFAGHNYPYFESQHKKLLQVPGFEDFSYKFNEKLLVRQNESAEDNYPTIVREALANIEHYVKAIGGCMAMETKSDLPKFGDNEPTLLKNEDKSIAIKPANEYEAILGDLADLQNLLVEFGNFVEGVKGAEYDLIANVQNLCEEVYNIFTGISNADNQIAIDKMLEDFTNDFALTKRMFEERKSVVLLPFAAKYWHTLEKVCQMYDNRPNVDVYVVPLPYYYKNYDGSFRDIQYDIDEYPANVYVWNYEEFNIEFLHPDEIIISNQYDNENPIYSVPKEWYSERIREFTGQLTWIPWFATDDFCEKDDREYTNLRYYLAMPGVMCADRIWAGSETLQKTYIQYMIEFSGEKYAGLWNDKIRPVEELYITGDAKDLQSISSFSTDSSGSLSDAKQLVFFISAGELAEYEYEMLDKLEAVLKIFDRYKDKINVIWFEDITMKEYLSKCDDKLAQRYADIRKSSGDNITFENACYEALAQNADAYYGSGSYVANLMRHLGKPVMLMSVH